MDSDLGTAARAAARLLVALAATAVAVVVMWAFGAQEARAHGQHTTSGAMPCHTLSGVRLCSHGPDAPPGGVNPREATTTQDLQRRAATGSYDSTGQYGAMSTRSATAVSCIGDGKSGPRVQAIYARLSGSPDRYATVLPLLRKFAGVADSFVSASAGQTRGGRRIRYVTSSCRLDVKRVTLSSRSTADFWRTISELQAKGYKSNNRKYLIWMDVGPASGICGVGTSMTDDRPGQLNTNNQITGYARVDRSCWGGGVEMHELWHTLGAVQPSAKYSTRYGHCRDEFDAMCYVDGPGVSMLNRCPNAGPWQLDCNHDTYFHTNPPARSYLATHWNTAKSRWLQSGTPPPTEPVITFPALGRRVAGRPIPLSATSKASSGRWIAAWRWTDDSGYCSWAGATTRTPTLWCNADTTGKITITATATDNKGDAATSSRVLPLYDPGTWTPTLTLKVSPDAISATGTKVTVDVAVKDAAGNPVYGMPVEFGSSSAYALSPASLTRGRTNRLGVIRRTQVVNAHTDYEVFSYGTAVWRQRSSRAAARWPVTIDASLSASTVQLPQKATITGTVSPLEPQLYDRGIQLERKSPTGAWEFQDYMTVAEDGKFSFALAEQAVGNTVFRVIKPDAGRYSSAWRLLTLTTQLVVHPQTLTITTPTTSPFSVSCGTPCYTTAAVTGTLSFWNGWYEPELVLEHQVGSEWLKLSGEYGWIQHDFDYNTQAFTGVFSGSVYAPGYAAGTHTFRVRALSWASYAGEGLSDPFTVTFGP